MKDQKNIFYLVFLGESASNRIKKKIVFHTTHYCLGLEDPILTSAFNLWVTQTMSTLSINKDSIMQGPVIHAGTTRCEDDLASLIVNIGIHSEDVISYAEMAEV